MKLALPQQTEITHNVTAALSEDIGSGDITAQLLDKNNIVTAQIVCRENAVLCGQAWVNEVFAQLSTDIQIQWQANDGDSLKPQQSLCTITGSAPLLLSGERSAINFLQTLSATATKTRKLAKLIRHTKTKILDTRKTIPGLRLAQKYAVHCGGGVNHRIGLFDAFLIKENHIIAAGGITPAIEKARALNSNVLLEIEVENLSELEEALQAKPDRILLDNFDIAQLKEAVTKSYGAVELEASGGITETGLIAIAETGVDYISLGTLTKDIKAIDFSMRLIP